MATELKPESQNSGAGAALASNDPSNFWMLRSSYDFSQSTDFDVTVRHTGKLPNPAVPAYTTLDLRLAWRARRDLELSLVGQNLAGPSHAEYGADPNRSVLDRSLFIKAVWQYQ
jgi:iron complex outermembrane receptor protein